MPASVDVIIRTTCARNRAPLLERAIHGVLAQDAGDPDVVLVVNGASADAALLSELTGNPRVRAVRQPEADPVAAITTGRRAVRAPYYCFLDDDDEILPGGIRARLDAFAATPEPDVVVTTGYRCVDGEDASLAAAIPTDGQEPVDALLDSNWLASCSGTFRSASVGEHLLRLDHRYFEWTVIAFNLATSGLNIRFAPIPTFRINDTPGSLSKSREFAADEVGVLQDLAQRAPSPHLRQKLRRKLGSAYHDASARALQTGAGIAAWRNHLWSITLPGGWRYLPYTVRVLARMPG